jgi:hypothetical protein
MTEVDKDFDLLAGHDLGESRAITNQDEEDPERMDVLVWHKLDTVGFQPSAREVLYHERNPTYVHTLYFHRTSSYFY